MKRISLLLCAALLVSLPAMAEVMIGVVDSQKLISDTEVGKVTALEVEKVVKAFDLKFQKLEMELRAKGENYQKQAPMLKPGARVDKENELKQEASALEQSFQKEQRETENLIQGKRIPMQKLFMQSIETVAKQEGYDIVLEKGTIVYSADSVDFTSKVIVEIEKSQKQ